MYMYMLNLEWNTQVSIHVVLQNENTSKDGFDFIANCYICGKEASLDKQKALAKTARKTIRVVKEIKTAEKLTIDALSKGADK